MTCDDRNGCGSQQAAGGGGTTDGGGYKPAYELEMRCKKTKNAFLVASCDVEPLKLGYAASLDCKNEKITVEASGMGHGTSVCDYERITRGFSVSIGHKKSQRDLSITKIRISREWLAVLNSGIYCQVAVAEYYGQSENRKSWWKNEKDMGQNSAMLGRETTGCWWTTAQHYAIKREEHIERNNDSSDGDTKPTIRKRSMSRTRVPIFERAGCVVVEISHVEDKGGEEEGTKQHKSSLWWAPDEENKIDT
ncbi:hypothetical protein EDC04DRAFT_2600913 [Pisolithus marmoratus]|nr:hypothetical protein EDC04DRAFT_2600913 [Pisolithus marmoratus]